MLGYVAGVVLQDRIANAPAILELKQAQAADEKERGEIVVELGKIRVLMENAIEEQRRSQERIDKILLQGRR